MKIKQESKLPQWELDVSCKCCGTEFALEGPEDMYRTYNLFLSDIFFCRCPKCNKTIRVPKRKIREDIKPKVRYR